MLIVAAIPLLGFVANPLAPGAQSAVRRLHDLFRVCGGGLLRGRGTRWLVGGATAVLAVHAARRADRNRRDSDLSGDLFDSSNHHPRRGRCLYPVLVFSGQRPAHRRRDAGRRVSSATRMSDPSKTTYGEGTTDHGPRTDQAPRTKDQGPLCPAPSPIGVITTAPGFRYPTGK